MNSYYLGLILIHDRMKAWLSYCFLDIGCCSQLSTQLNRPHLTIASTNSCESWESSFGKVESRVNCYFRYLSSGKDSWFRISIYICVCHVSPRSHRLPDRLLILRTKTNYRKACSFFLRAGKEGNMFLLPVSDGGKVLSLKLQTFEVKTYYVPFHHKVSNKW